MTDKDTPNAGATAEFVREERFIVIKRKHLPPMKEAVLRNEMRLMGIGTVECVVVESDWPEYETVWRMIEARVSGKPSAATKFENELGNQIKITIEGPTSISENTLTMVEALQLELSLCNARLQTATTLAQREGEMRRLRQSAMRGADFLDLMLDCWVTGKEISDEDGKRATAALMALNSALSEQGEGR